MFLYYKHWLAATSVGLFSELSNMKVALGTTEFVAGHSEASVILGITELEAGVRRQGGLLGTVALAGRFP